MMWIEVMMPLVYGFDLELNINLFTSSCFPVRRDVQENDEEAVRVKEQSILELGTLLAKTGQAAGKMSFFAACTQMREQAWCKIQ